MSEDREARPVPWTVRLMIMAGIALMIFAAAGLFMNNDAAKSGGVQPPRVGQRLANFTLHDLNGSPVRLSDFSGKTVLINAWATWCPPCRAEMPALNDFYRDYQSRGLVVLAINVGETREQAAGFVNQFGLKFPIALDPDQSLMDSWAIHDFPTSILVGTDGKVKAIHIGLISPAQLKQEFLPYIP